VVDRLLLVRKIVVSVIVRQLCTTLSIQRLSGIVQAVSRRLTILSAQVRSQIRPHGCFNRLRESSVLVHWFLLPVFTPTSVPSSLIIASLTLHSLETDSVIK
jgi:hypothetical protein